jgi:hypothetical protein
MRPCCEKACVLRYCLASFTALCCCCVSVEAAGVGAGVAVVGGAVVGGAVVGGLFVGAAVVEEPAAFDERLLFAAQPLAPISTSETAAVPTAFVIRRIPASSLTQTATECPTFVPGQSLKPESLVLFSLLISMNLGRSVSSVWWLEYTA